ASATTTSNIANFLRPRRANLILTAIIYGFVKDLVPRLIKMSAKIGI
ncbi:MAG: hypothetical protein RL567_92, partial [Bacteroidota bacterium]